MHLSFWTFLQKWHCTITKTYFLTETLQIFKLYIFVVDIFSTIFLKNLDHLNLSGSCLFNFLLENSTAPSSTVTLAIDQAHWIFLHSLNACAHFVRQPSKMFVTTICTDLVDKDSNRNMQIHYTLIFISYRIRKSFKNMLWI